MRFAYGGGVFFYLLCFYREQEYRVCVCTTSTNVLLSFANLLKGLVCEVLC
jgi:hypothetical protein